MPYGTHGHRVVGIRVLIEPPGSLSGTDDLVYFIKPRLKIISIRIRARHLDHLGAKAPHQDAARRRRLGIDHTDHVEATMASHHGEADSQTP